VEIGRSGGGSTDLAVLFGIASALTLVGQLPLAAVTARVGSTPSLVTGFVLMALAFVSVAVVATTPAAPGWRHLLPAAGMVVLLVLGQMLVVPTAKHLIPVFADGRPLGAYYGALASGGGLMVLLGSIVIGSTLDLARHPSPTAWLPWALMAAFPLVSAALLLTLAPLPLEKDQP
jgi:MFS family permease